jgi:hypothetical protein
MSYQAKPIWFYNPAVPTPQIRQAIDNFSTSWLPMHSRKDELQLYHYTTIKGLKGIIENRSLWLTHTSTLNDPTELKYGKELIISILSDQLLHEYDELLNKFIQALIGEINRFDEIMYNTYVACFCESATLLSQWRAYGHKGGGYNLGIEFTSDTKFFSTPDQSEEEIYVILRKIIYNSKEQKALISGYISLVISYANDAIKYFKTHNNKPEAWELMAAMEAANLLCDMMLTFKNSVFSEENEWRLILVRQPEHKADQLHFIDNDIGMIPYFETYIIDKKDDQLFFPLRTIRFGPILEIPSTKSALRLYIQKQSVSESKIKIANAICISDAGFSLR